MEGLIRDIGKEEATMLLKIVMENNIKILGLQKTLMIIIKRNKQEINKKQEKELKGREYKKDWKKNREEERKKLDNKQRRVEKIRIRKKKSKERVKIIERRENKNRKKAIMERKYFVCESFGYINCNCKNVENREEERSTSMPSNKFEVLKSRVINMKKRSEKEIGKDKR